MSNQLKIGLVILVIGTFLFSIGAKGCLWWRDKDDDDIITGSSGTPTPTPTAIAAGGFHNVALLSDGTVKAWGRNNWGQLGDGTVLSRTIPTLVSGLTGVTVIAGGYDHSVVLLSDGAIMAWGSNSLGQLGDGTTEEKHIPVSVADITTATAIAGGAFYSIALLDDGTIQTWGTNEYGQLGIGSSAMSSTVPVLVPAITTATAIAAGWFHNTALLADGTIMTWGRNNYGQLGIGSSAISSTVPVLVPGITTAKAIAGGGIHTVALLEDGTIMTWGRNNYGQLGLGTWVTSSTTPALVSGITTAKAIAAGGYSTFALLEDGTVKSWGANGHGQLGNGTVLSSTSPTLVPGITTAKAIAAGRLHTLALLEDKSIKTWGDNTFSQLGDGSLIYSSTPIWGLDLRGHHLPTNRPPILIIGPKTVDQNQLLSFTISAIDPNNDTLAYSATDLPAGAIFNPTTRSFNWTPDTKGSYPGINFTVTDPGSLSDAKTITVTVVASSPPYYITFNVLDELTYEHLTDLGVNCDVSGWSENFLSSPITHTYAAGAYGPTRFMKVGYAEVAVEDWDADSHKTFTIYMEKSEP